MAILRWALSEVVTDVFQSPAVGVLLSLEREGFTVAIAGDRLRVKPISKLTVEQRAAIEQHRTGLLTLLRMCDDGVQDRRRVFAERLAAAGETVPPLVYRSGTCYVPGVCYSCRESLPHPRHGRCWRCGLAARLACRAPIAADVAAEYDDARIA